jgi:phage terminase large subunit
MELQIHHTKVFDDNYKEYEKGKRFIINQGGSRSSKTYSIIQLLIFISLTTPDIKISIVRKSFPALRGSVLRDFVEIMSQLNLYDENRHNKTNQVYYFTNGAEIEFFSVDVAQKVRGRKRDICYLNEANELEFEDFTQLSLRTNKCLFIDFNPSDTDHWLYELLNDARSILLKSTYKDNIFLSKEIITEIENLINVDENYYKIYALGERPISTTRIYSHFKTYTDNIGFDDWCYGLDIGFNHSTALVKVGYRGDIIYVEEIIYKNKITLSDLIEEMKDKIGGDRKMIYVDSARPDVVEELRRNGWNASGASKQVKEGIDYIKSKQILINNNSLNLLREYKLYSWRSKGNYIFDEPVKLNDDGMDAMRYGIFTHKKKSFNEFYTNLYSA